MFKEDIKNLPQNPGVYLMHNVDGEVIYVGKAKNIKNRVSQYFQTNKNHSPKVLAMIDNISYFEYIITGTEFEALVLECSLIKKYMPKYNILLKDDKNYPYLKLTLDEEFPRIMPARKRLNDGGKYFGPFVSMFVVKETIDLIKNIFNVRSCNRVLPRDIGKNRQCLNFDIKKCSGPCINMISQEDYKKIFDDVVQFLEGNYSKILEQLQNQMQTASENLEFEKAAKIRDRINAIKTLSEKQRVVSQTKGNQDVIAFVSDNKTICFQIFFIRSGKVVGREHFIVKNENTDDNMQIMTDFVKQYYSMTSIIPNSIILQNDVYDNDLLEQWLSEKTRYKIKLIVPKKGEKFNIVKMVEKNALETLKLNKLKNDISTKKLDDLMFEIKSTLNLADVPTRIEAYDISNISGADSVGVCIVFENGVFKKNGYKKFNIRSTQTADDYKSMKEVLYRRISNGLENEKGFTPLPDLILLDGGKGHVSVAKEVLDFLKVQIPVFGIVKDDNHKTRGIIADKEEIWLKKTGIVFKTIKNIQDEVHRFAIEAHKKKHKNATIKSELNSIKGVGDKKRNILLKHFKTISAIKNATIDELKEVAGIDEKTAISIYEHYSLTQ